MKPEKKIVDLILGGLESRHLDFNYANSKLKEVMDDMQDAGFYRGLFWGSIVGMITSLILAYFI